MLPRLRFAVGCSHCQGLQASRCCPACGRPVCKGCHPVWASCPEPRAGELQLCRGRRAVDVDASGAVLLAAAPGLWQQRFDLEGAPLEAARRWFEPGPLPRLAAGGRLVRTRRNPLTLELEALLIEEPPGHEPRRFLHLLHRGPAGLPRRLSICPDGRFALLLLRPDLLLIYDLDGKRAARELRLDRPAVCEAVSQQLGLVAIGGGDGTVELLELDGPGRRRVAAGEGEIGWIGLGGDLLAVRDQHGVVVRDLDGGLGWRLDWRGRGPLALSPDARWLAGADRGSILLWRRGAVLPRPLLEGTGRVDLLRFVLGGRLLIGADRAGGVFFWPIS